MINRYDEYICRNTNEFIQKNEINSKNTIIASDELSLPFCISEFWLFVDKKNVPQYSSNSIPAFNACYAFL